jgi:hypothetical protein
LDHSNPAQSYRFSNDSVYAKDEDLIEETVRMEISLCFGKHKSRESCSGKVDAMVERLAIKVNFLPKFQRADFIKPSEYLVIIYSEKWAPQANIRLKFDLLCLLGFGNNAYSSAHHNY